MSTSDAVSFSDLAVGDSSAPLVIEGIGRTHFVRYAGASGDFNPMHHDDAMAQQYGNPSVFGHGMLTAGIAARSVKDWFGPTALRQLDVRFAKQVWPGETLTSTATVSSLSTDEVSGEGRAELTLSVVNADGEEKLNGTATVAVAQ